MFPIILKQGIDIVMFLWFINVINLYTNLTSKKSSIFSLAPSAKYESPQQISVIISSCVFCIRILINVGIAFLIWLYFGAGFPLQRFASVHEAFLVKGVSGIALSKIIEINSMTPLYITLSLVYVLSPAIFPIPHITYSITS